MSQITKPGIPGRTGGLNRNTELTALNEIIKRLKTLISVTSTNPGLPTNAATLSEQQIQTTELNTLNATVLSLLNSLVASQDIEILLVRDTGNGNIVIQQIREYDQGTGTWSTRYEDVSGTVYLPTGPLEYLDTSAVLNLILVELQNIELNTDTNATEAKQDDIITELQNLLNEPDYEITKSIGFDSFSLIPINLTNLTFDSLGLGGGTPPTFTNVTGSDFEVSLSNARYSMSFDVVGSYSTVDFVNIFIKVEQVLPNPGTEGIAFSLIESGAAFPGPVLDVKNTGSFLPGDVKILNLSYDNRSNNFNNFEVHFLAPFPGTYPPNQAYKITLLGATAGTYTPSDQITEYIKWEDNIQSGVEYRDYLNQPYNLNGFFIKDLNKATEERLSTYLSDIATTNTTLTNLLNRNTFTQELLPQNVSVDSYVNFKELTFTVITGSVDVTVGAGNPITFPVGNVVGATYSADDLSNTTVNINRTNGSYLVTVKS